MKRIHLAIEGIVAATLATVACGDTAATTSDGKTQAFAVYADQSEFTCASPLPALLEDLTPAAPFDFLEVRSQSVQSDSDGGVHAYLDDDGGTAPGSVVATRGTACATATDAATCRTALAVLASNGTGWTAAYYGGNGVPTREYAVYTRGNEVGKLETPSDIAAFLGTIDTLGDARLVARAAAQPTLSCEKTTKDAIQVPDPGWRRNADGSWEMIAVFDNCGPGVTRARYKIGTSGTAEVVDRLSVSTTDGAICGRRPEGLRDHAHTGQDIGAYFAEIAWLEAAAVVAFRGVERDLRALGAPACLIADARRAQADEIRHAREATELARRFGSKERTLDVAPPTNRDRFAIALENAVEGCVRETYGALVAAYQARKAQDPAIRRFFARIAGDEARHAELSHTIAAWIEPTLTAAERAEVAIAKKAALAELFASTTHRTPFADQAGLPSQRDAHALLVGMDREILAAA